jgi:hypothetical protein
MKTNDSAVNLQTSSSSVEESLAWIDGFLLPTLANLLFLFMVLGLGAGSAFGSVRWETLQAIHWVENPHDSARIGACGERGPYQFTFATWRMHTQKPFAFAMERSEADFVAVSHYEWIKRGLERHGIESSPYNIALAWNAGLAQVVRGCAPGVAHRYAGQVHNLVVDLQRRLASTR